MTEAAGSTPEPAAVSALRFPEGFAFVGSGFLLVLELVAGRLLALGVVIGGSILGAGAVSSSGCTQSVTIEVVARRCATLRGLLPASGRSAGFLKSPTPDRFLGIGALIFALSVLRCSGASRNGSRLTSVRFRTLESSGCSCSRSPAWPRESNSC